MRSLEQRSLALARDTARAEAFSPDLAKRFPDDTLLQLSYLPALHAQIAHNRNDPSLAIEALEAATPYELGTIFPIALYPVYVRGKANLEAHRGSQAAAEFQKILNHPGLVSTNHPRPGDISVWLAPMHSKPAQAPQPRVQQETTGAPRATPR